MDGTSGHTGSSTGLPTAYTAELTSRVTKLTRRQLDYWDATDVIKPSIAAFEGRGAARLYSFRDLIKLKVGAGLRKRGWLPNEIRRLVSNLEQRGWQDPLVTATLVAAKEGGREVLLLDPSMDRPISLRDLDQLAEPMDIPLEEIRTGLETTISALLTRRTGQVAKVRDLQGSEPVIAATRVPVERIKELRRRGWDEARTLAAHPHLTVDDIRAALAEPDVARARSA